MGQLNPKLRPLASFPDSLPLAGTQGRVPSFSLSFECQFKTFERRFPGCIGE